MKLLFANTKPKTQLQALRNYRDFQKLKRRCINASRQQYLNRLARDFSLATNTSPSRLYRYLTKYATQLALTDLEIAGWAILLQSLPDSEKVLSTAKVLLFTAYTAKKILGSTNFRVDQKLNSTVPNFTLNYENWLLLTSSSSDLSLKQVNEKLRKLKEPVHVPEKKGYFEDLVSFIMTKKADSGAPESLSDHSTIADWDVQMETFENEIMGGEKLPPIDTLL